jgi:flavin prenyltransferase
MKTVVAITGASGVGYGIRLVEELSEKNEVFLVVSSGAKKTMEYEAPLAMKSLPKNIKIFSEDQIDASIASSSFQIDAAVVCPCSMKTLSAISVGYSNNLITRCADVMIKERKKLILCPRETPLSPIHLENMLKLSRIGVTIMPLSPGWYHSPKKLEDMQDFIVGKILDSLGIENTLFKRWK